MPEFGHEPSRDPAPRPGDQDPRAGDVVGRGRFGQVIPAEEPFPEVTRLPLPDKPPPSTIEPSHQPSGRRRGPGPVLLAAAVVVAAIVGASSVLVLSSGDDVVAPPGSSVPVSSVAGPNTSLDFDVTIPPNTTPGATTTTEPWVPLTVPEDAIVYPSPGLVQPRADIVEFRGDSTTEILVLSNTGGGAADWLLSVSPGSGLDVSPAAGQLKPGESIEIRILLDRANGRDLSDWAEELSMIGGGNTRPSIVKVKIFEI